MTFSENLTKEDEYDTHLSSSFIQMSVIINGQAHNTCFNISDFYFII